jgi:hypothetical protein
MSKRDSSWGLKMETIDCKYRGLEIWDVDDVAPAIRDEATAAALAVLDLEGVLPLEARDAQFTLEAMHDKGVLYRAEPSDLGFNMAHPNACLDSEGAARRVIERLAPNRAEPYLMLGVADWALSEWQAHDTDPTRI